MTGSSIPADQKVSQSKTATLTKKEKRPTRDLTRAEEKELEKEGPKRTVKVETSQAEWTTAASPLPEGASEGTHTTKAGETKEKKLLSFRVLRRTKPEVTLQRVTAPQSPPKIESTRDVSESKGSPRCPSETEASSLVSLLSKTESMRQLSLMLNQPLLPGSDWTQRIPKGRSFW